jgi:type I restriction enzyme S subunit
MMGDTMPFSEFVEINPKVALKKGIEYPFVEMDIVTPGRRYISSINKRIYKGGGAKFQAGDTLFARITPCLENGKIAQFAGANSEIGFGSTEFFIFRHKEGISDPGYVFYLASSDILRKPAEKSMSGASGRQRADIASIKDLEIPAPPLLTQHKIASILSAYDDLIENNTRRIKILEEIAQALYREWFVKFRFPGHERVRMVESELGIVPEEWEVKKLGDACNILMGQSPKSEFYNDTGEGLPFHQGVTDFGDRFPIERMYCTVQNRIAEAGDILFSVRAPVGRINITDKKIIIGRGLCAIRSKSGYQAFVFQQLKEKFKEEDSMGGGTIFKSVTKDDMQGINFLVPSEVLLMSFEENMSPIFAELKNLTIKITNLRRTRDLLLPKLISGKIDITKIGINVQEKVDS